MLSFQHKLLQEYLAAVYIAENIKPDTAETFLNETFPTWEEIETHREVVQFACGILDNDHVYPLLNYVSKCTAKHIHNELDNGKELPDTSILASCQKESGISTMNQHLSLYPSCRRPLAEVLANTELVYIEGIDMNDPLELSPGPGPAKVIVKLVDVGSDSYVDRLYDRLWEALHSAHSNLITLHLEGVSSKNLKLQHFKQMKYLALSSHDWSESSGENLAASIEAWGAEPQLSYCRLYEVPIPGSLLTALSRCNKLMTLRLTNRNLHDKLSVLMESPPPLLRCLVLQACCLHGGDVEHIAQVIRAGRLSHLQEVNISANPVGEVAVGHLLQELINTRANTKLTLVLAGTGVDEDGEDTELSVQFEAEWKAKLTHTDWDVSM